MTSARPRADWAHLSAELWNLVFDKIEPENREVDMHKRLTDHVQQFYQLPGVCTRFNSIIRQSPDLHTLLFINDSINGVDLHSMCAHIAHHCSSVQKVVAECGSPYVEAALTTLLSHENGSSKLATLDLSANLDEDFCQLYDTVLLLVTQFSALTACTLCTNSTLADGQPYSFDLGALKALPHLARLELSLGNFTSLEAASHLTYLSLTACQVNCGADCGFVSSLVESHSRLGAVLADFHTHGASLQCISIGVGVAVAEFPDSLSTLTNLTSLDVQGRLDKVQIKFSVDWAKLVSLEELQISGFSSRRSGQVRFTQTLAHLSCLAKLWKVSLLHCVNSIAGSQVRCTTWCDFCDVCIVYST